MSIALFTWRVAAAIGLKLGDRFNDRIGYQPVIAASLTVMALAFLGLSICGFFLTPAAARVALLPLVVLWSMSAWSFFPAQQSRLISVAGAKVAPVVLSLNASFQ